MPQQETVFEESVGDRRIEVLKSYDQICAHEALRNMNGQARQILWGVLKPEEAYDLAELPSLDDPEDVNGESEAFMWDELLEQAREDGNLLSFFIVNEATAARTGSLYVSPDWPSDESFARARVAAIVSGL